MMPAGSLRHWSSLSSRNQPQAQAWHSGSYGQASVEWVSRRAKRQANQENAVGSRVRTEIVGGGGRDQSRQCASRALRHPPDRRLSRRCGCFGCHRRTRNRSIADQVYGEEDPKSIGPCVGIARGQAHLRSARHEACSADAPGNAVLSDGMAARVRRTGRGLAGGRAGTAGYAGSGNPCKRSAHGGRKHLPAQGH